jgi:hypothetical protein
VSIPDPRDAPNPWYARWAAPLLNDPRDVVMVALIMQCLALAAAGVGLFFAGSWFWWLVPVYGVALFAGLIDRFTLMLHCTSHRQLFKPGYALANQIIPWVLSPRSWGRPPRPTSPTTWACTTSRRTSPTT